MDYKTKKRIFEYCEKIDKIDEERQKATDKYSDIMYPWTDRHIIEVTLLSSFLDWLKIIDEWLVKELDYYFYEALFVEETIIATKDWKEYNISDREDFLFYLENEE